MLRTSNPVLSSKSFGGFVEPDHPAAPVAAGQTMTVAGTVNKTAVLLALVMLGALWPWHVMKFDPEAALSWMLIGMVGGTDHGADHHLQEGLGGAARAALRRV